MISEGSVAVICILLLKVSCCWCCCCWWWQCFTSFLEIWNLQQLKLQPVSSIHLIQLSLLLLSLPCCSRVILRPFFCVHDQWDYRQALSGPLFHSHRDLIMCIHPFLRAPYPQHHKHFFQSTNTWAVANWLRSPLQLISLSRRQAAAPYEESPSKSKTDLLQQPHCDLNTHTHAYRHTRTHTHFESSQGWRMWWLIVDGTDLVHMCI